MYSLIQSLIIELFIYMSWFYCYDIFLRNSNKDHVIYNYVINSYLKPIKLSFYISPYKHLFYLSLLINKVLFNSVQTNKWFLNKTV